ncbi:MAG: hypothetical protein ACRDY2_13825 [Acidimicrobiales bacterium]
MSTTLRLTREGVALELRRGTFEILLDGKAVGSLQNHDTVETPLEPGHHTLRIRVGRYSSRDHSFDAAEGDIVNFRCTGGILWPRYVVSLFKPDLAISLKRD